MAQSSFKALSFVQSALKSLSFIFVLNSSTEKFSEIQNQSDNTSRESEENLTTPGSNFDVLQPEDLRIPGIFYPKDSSLPNT